jgi:hypothetical protein
MEMVGSNGYALANNINKNWRLFLNFMTNDGTSYKNSTTTGVTGNMYADLTAYLLSDNGTGPDGIRLVGNSSNTTTYDIWIQFEPYAGIVSFTSSSPEITAFVGTSGTPPTNVPYMIVTRSEIYHDNDPPPSVTN